MITGPFLTDLDTRAQVKGSRDPLGIQSIWTRFGRHVVGNLTTVSSSVRDYTTLILGYYFAEQLSAEAESGSELGTFLKWEQLVGYARAAINDDPSFRGTGRVQQNLANNTVRLSADRSRQILGNQKIYGLWGLFTMPARTSGLLDDGAPPRPTALAQELIETLYLPILEEGAGRGAKGILELLRAPDARVDLRGRHKRVVQAVARVSQLKLLPRERKVFRDCLVLGGPTDATRGRQGQLAELLAASALAEGFSWSPRSVDALVDAARARGEGWSELAHRLDRIRVCESVMAPMSALFVHLLGLEGKTIDAVVSRLEQQWRGGANSIQAKAFADVVGEIAQDGTHSADRWRRIAQTAYRGEYRALISLLVEQNAAVMDARGGAPWISIASGKLNVRFRDEQGDLPGRSELPELWRFSYFLDSLRTVVATVGLA